MKQLFYILLLFISYHTYAQQAETMVQLGHSDRVRCVSMTPDGQYAVTGSSDNTIKLWNMSNGLLIRTFNGHRGLVYAVQISKDGKTIYSCSWDDQRIIKWDALTGKILKQLVNPKSPVSCIALSHSNQWLACKNDDGVFLLNTNDFSTYRKLPMSNAKLIQFSDDDKSLFIATSEYKKEKILTYSMSDGKLLQSMPGIYSPDAMSAHHDIVVLSNYESLVCYQLSTQKKIEAWAKDSLRYTTSTLNEAGTQLAYALEDGSVNVKTIDGKPLLNQSGDIVNLVKAHTGMVNDLVFSTDGRFLLTASNDWTSKLYSLATGKVVRNFASISEYLQSLSLSGSGNYLAFSSGHLETGNHVGVWDLQRGKLLPFFKGEGANEFITQIAFSTRNKSIGASCVNGKLSWYAFPGNGNSGDMSIGSAPMKAVTMTPNGKNYLGGTKDGNILFWRPDRNKSETIFADKSGIGSLAVSPDGASFAAGTLDGKLLLYSYESKALSKTIESHSLISGYYDTSMVMAYGSVTSMSMDGNFAMKYTSIMSVAYSPDGKYIAACGGSWIKIFDATTGELIKHIKQYGAGFSTISFSANGKLICSGGADFMVRLYDVTSGTLIKSFAGHQNEVRSVLFSNNQKYIFSGSLDTQLKIWDITSGKELLSYLILKGGNDYIITNPQGYYFATKGAAKALSFRIGNEIYPFEQFDLKYNRPDIILNDISRLAFEDEKNNPNVPLIKSYYVAYQKRLVRAGFDEKQLGGTFHVPTIAIVNNQIPISTKASELHFKIKAEDPIYALKSLHVWVNDVPVYGVRGKAITGNSVIEECALTLSNEKNKITVSCINAQGVESYKEQFEIVYEGGAANYTTYFIGIGVSRYQDSSFNLKYAEKDVSDLSKQLQLKNAKVILLTNEKATKANILALKELLMKTSVNDKVIISLSGHGLLSKSLDFYYATYDMDFQHPELKGLLYDDLEDLLDGIPSRNKLLLVDACHSGEIDKSENIRVVNGPANPGVSGIAARGSDLIIDSNSIGLENSFELMQDLFSDISNGNGAIVISAAGGKEYALESAQWNNGVFTYCVLNALQNGAADIDKNQKTTIEELKNYVSAQVQILTGGRQRPTSRKENTENNWEVW